MYNSLRFVSQPSENTLEQGNFSSARLGRKISTASNRNNENDGNSDKEHKSGNRIIFHEIARGRRWPHGKIAV